jgi:hypothetical protein
MRKVWFIFIFLFFFACERKGDFVRVDFKLDGAGGVPTYVSSITVDVRWENATSPIVAVIPLDKLETQISVPPGEKRVFTAYASVDDGTPVLTGRTVKDILPDTSNEVFINMGFIEYSGFVHDPLGDSNFCDINGVFIKRIGDFVRISIWVAPDTNLSEETFFYVFLDLDQNPLTYIGDLKFEIGPDAGVIIYPSGWTSAYVFNDWDYEYGGPLYYSSSFPAFVTGNKISVDIPISAFGIEDGLMDFTTSSNSFSIGELDTTGVGRMPKGSTEPANPFYSYANGKISVIAGSTLGDGGDAISAPLGDKIYSMVITGNELIYHGSAYGKGFLRKIDLSTGKIYNLAGIVTDVPQSFIEAEFPVQVTIPYPRSGPYFEGIDKYRNFIYFTDREECTIKRVDLNAKKLEVVAGVPGMCSYTRDGLATSVYLNQPSDLFVDQSNGDVYFSDTGNNIVRRIRNGYVETIAGKYPSSCSPVVEASYSGPSTNACLSGPLGLFPDGVSGFYVADSGNYIFRWVDYSGTITTVAGDGNYGDPSTLIGSPLLSVSFSYPTDIFLWQNYLFFVDGGGYIYYDNGGYLNAFSPSYSFSLAYPSSSSLYVLRDNSIYYTSSVTAPSFTKVAGSPFPYSLHGGDGGDALGSSLEDPAGLGVYNGEVYFLERNLSSLYKISSGKLLRVAGNGQSKSGCISSAQISPDLPIFSYPQDLAIGSDGKIFVADGDCTVKVVDFSKNEIKIIAGNCYQCYSPIDGSPASSSPLLSLTHIEVGGDGSVYVSMMGGNEPKFYSLIYSIDPSGIIHHIGGSSSGVDVWTYTGPTDARNVNFGYIYFISIDRNNSYLYVGGDNAVWRIDLKTKVAEIFMGEQVASGGIIKGSPPSYKSALYMYGLYDIFPFGNDLFIGASYSDVFGFNRWIQFRIAGYPYKSGFKGMNGRAIDSLIYSPVKIDYDGKDIYVLLNSYGFPGGRILKISPVQ